MSVESFDEQVVLYKIHGQYKQTRKIFIMVGKILWCCLYLSTFQCLYSIIADFATPILSLRKEKLQKEYEERNLNSLAICGKNSLGLHVDFEDFTKKMFHFVRMIWYIWRKYNIDYLLILPFWCVVVMICFMVMLYCNWLALQNIFL